MYIFYSGSLRAPRFTQLIMQILYESQEQPPQKCWATTTYASLLFPISHIYVCIWNNSEKIPRYTYTAKQKFNRTRKCPKVFKAKWVARARATEIGSYFISRRAPDEPWSLNKSPLLSADIKVYSLFCFVLRNNMYLFGLRRPKILPLSEQTFISLITFGRERSSGVQRLSR